MTDYPRQIVIPNPLWSFMQYSEVYCTAACCGLGAFEIHAALLLRKVLDENLGGRDGNRQFHIAKRQLRDLIQYCEFTDLEALGENVPIWNEEPINLPQYWLPRDKIKGWLSEWNHAFEKASIYNGLEKE